MEANDKEASSPETGYYLLFVDGNRNGSAGPMAGGVLQYRHNGKWATAPDGRFSTAVGTDSIDTWEYTALIEGLKLARRSRVKHLRAYMDRESVVEQVCGRWRVAAEQHDLHAEVMTLIEDLDFRLSWLPREMNSDADAAARS